MPEVLEHGRVYFFYRPRVQREEAHGLDDVQRFQVVLSPDGKAPWRLVRIGRKRMPAIGDGGERVWGVVDKVTDGPEEIVSQLDRQRYGTRTRGLRVQAEARPAGQGVYAIARHDDHTHLAYVLELPQAPGPVQEELNIEPRASYVVAVRNPSSSPWAGFGAGAPEGLPADLQETFRGRRFAPLSPEFLNHVGIELILMAATRDPEEALGIELRPAQESEAEAAIFTDLRIERDRYPVAPLFDGRWE
jgi:hypothetical protein